MKAGDLILLQLVEREEIIGEYIGEDENFYQIAKAAQIFILMADASGQQAHPQRTIMPVDDKGNFGGMILVAKGKVLLIKSIIEGSGVYNIYKQAVTGIVMPPQRPGIVMPFIKPDGGANGRGGAPKGGVA